MLWGEREIGDETPHHRAMPFLNKRRVKARFAVKKLLFLFAKTNHILCRARIKGMFIARFSLINSI
jgi:hypothetical protein